MSKLMKITAMAAMLGMAASAQANVNLTAETASPGSTPGVSVISLSEVASKFNVANIQVTPGQTLTNSVQNVAEGKTDIAAAPFILPFLMSRGIGPYGKLGKEKGSELASKRQLYYIAIVFPFRGYMPMTVPILAAGTGLMASVSSMARRVALH